MLRTMTDIIEVIKDIISNECGERKVFDKDVATALDLKTNSIGTLKSRNSIPFKKICEFASKKKLDLNYILTVDTKRMSHVQFRNLGR